MVAPIGSNVKTTDDLVQNGYDYAPLAQGGMVIVDKDSVVAGAAKPVLAGTKAFLKVTAAGTIKYSANGTSGWTATLPTLTAGQPVDLYFKVDAPTPADNGDYLYSYVMVADTTNGTGPGHMSDGIGGLKLTWAKGIAHVTGAVPADQVGLKFGIKGKVTDWFGTSFETPVVQKAWA